jgi:hypothetical protein
MRVFMGNRRQYTWLQCTCTVYIISAVYMHRIRHQYVRDARRRVYSSFSPPKKSNGKSGWSASRTTKNASLGEGPDVPVYVARVSTRRVWFRRGVRGAWRKPVLRLVEGEDGYGQGVVRRGRDRAIGD